MANPWQGDIERLQKQIDSHTAQITALTNQVSMLAGQVNALQSAQVTIVASILNTSSTQTIALVPNTRFVVIAEMQDITHSPIASPPTTVLTTENVSTAPVSIGSASFFISGANIVATGTIGIHYQLLFVCRP